MLDKLTQHGIGVSSGGNIKSLQRVTTILSSSNPEQINISQVNINNSIIRLSYSGRHAKRDDRVPVAHFIDSSTIEITGYANVMVTFEVIEFKNVKSIQRGVVNFNGNIIGTTTNITISPTNPLKSMLLCMHKSNSTSIAPALYNKIVDEVTISLYKYGNANDTITVYWQVIEFN